MAKTKVWSPRRIRSEDDRGSSSSQYMTLNEGDKFLGYALFEGDPSVDDPAYYEYAEHWVASGAKGSSVPCAGDDCPVCEDGDRPRTRAKTLWLVTQDEKGNKLDPPELRIFNFNYNIIKAVTEMRAEQEKIKGRLFRVSRLDDRGNYTLMPKTDMLKAADVKAAVKDPAAPDFDAMVTTQLRKAMEGLAVSRAVEDDDDDEPEDKATKKTGKPAAGKSSGKAAKAAEWPDELADMEVTVVEVDDEGNYVQVSCDGFKGNKNVFTTGDIDFDLTTLSEDDTLTVSADIDNDGDYILNAEPEAAEGEEAEEEEDEATATDLPESIEDTEFTVKSVDADESTMEIENEDLSFTLFFLDQGPASEVDFDDYEEGMTIIVSAEKDSQDDMVATEIPKVKKAKGAAAKKGSTAGRKKTTTTKGK